MTIKAWGFRHFIPSSVVLILTMKPIFVIVSLAVIASAFAIPVDDQALTVSQPRELDVLGTYRILIENLVRDLKGAAKDAADAFKSFNEGLKNLAIQYRDKITNDVQKLRDRVTGAIKNLSNRLSSTGTAVRTCIESRNIEAASIFNETVENTMACTNQRIEEVSGMLTNLNAIGASASDLASAAMRNMNACSQGTEGILASSSCYGKVAVQTEMKATAFITQTGLEIARVNMAIATLPAALDVCAGSRLVEAGLSTARVVMEISSCTASGIFSIFK